MLHFIKTFGIFSSRLLASTALCVSILTGCSGGLDDAESLRRNTYIELVDWHISGFWIINSPVAWIRVANYNAEPVKDLLLVYKTYDSAGSLLNEGTYTLDDTIGPGKVKNFFSEYLGFVDLDSQKLSIELRRVRKGQKGSEGSAHGRT